MLTQILQIKIPNLYLEFTHVKSKPHLTGDNELIDHYDNLCCVPLTTILECPF